MALYDDIIASIVAYIKDNANGEIGGNGLQSRLTAMVTALGTNSHLMGVITATKNMGAVPNTKQFWFAVNNTTSSYNVNGVGLSTTAIYPGHMYIVHNTNDYWEINDLTESMPLGLFGIISSAQNIGAIPTNRGFYIAFNSSDSSYNITGSGSFSLSVAQNCIYVIHNITGAWLATNISSGLATLISNTVSTANNAVTNVNTSFNNMLTRGCITLCLPSAGSNVLVAVKNAIRIDKNDSLDVFAKPDETEKIADMNAVPIGDSLVSRIYITSGDVECRPGQNPYGAIPNCVIVEGNVYKISKTEGFWGKTRSLILNVPHFCVLESDVVNELLSNGGKLVVHSHLVSDYQLEYPSLNVTALNKAMILYATANA